MDKKNKKKFGRFYTPNSYAAMLSELVLNDFLASKPPNQFDILDPSCGDGVFLIEIAKYLKNKMKRTKPLFKINLYGNDIDQKAIHSAEENLSGLTDGKFLNPRFSITDLLISQSLGEKSKHKPDETCVQQEKYDIIIGNPPWVSLIGKHAQKCYTKTQINFLLRRYPCDTYRPNLFEMFIWRSLELLKPSGYLAFIVPDRLLHNKQYSDLRKVLFTKYEIHYLFHNLPFSGVNSDNIFFVLKNNNPCENFNMKIKSEPDDNWIGINQKWFYNNGCRSLSTNPLVKKILDKIDNTTASKLSENFYTGVGFITDKNLISAEKCSPQQLKIVTGRDISSKGIKKHRYFDFTKENLKGGTSNISILSKKPKILLRKTGNRLISCVDYKGLLPEQSLYFIICKSNSKNHLNWLNILLNSNIMSFYYLNKAITNINSTPQIKKRDLDSLPILFPKTLFPSDRVVNPSGLQSRLNRLTESKIAGFYKLTVKEMEFIDKFLKDN